MLLTSCCVIQVVGFLSNILAPNKCVLEVHNSWDGQITIMRKTIRCKKVEWAPCAYLTQKMPLLEHSHVDVAVVRLLSCRKETVEQLNKAFRCSVWWRRESQNLQMLASGTLSGVGCDMNWIFLPFAQKQKAFLEQLRFWHFLEC